MTVEQLSEKRNTVLATARELANNPESDLAQVKGLMAEAEQIAARIEAVKALGEMAPVAPKVNQVDDQPWKAGSVGKNPFPGSRDEANFKAYAFGQWVRSTMGVASAKAWVKDNLKAQSEGTTTAGGFTVPDPLSSDLIYLREQYGVARQNCKIYPMSSDTLAVPNGTGSTSVYYPNENAAITPSDMTFSQVTLTAKKMAILTQVSKELAEDSIIDFGATLARDMAFAMAKEEDRVVFKNTVDATSGIDGILYAVSNLDGTKTNIGNAVVFTTAQTPAFSPALADLRAMVGKVPTYATNAKWYMHKRIWFDAIAPRLDALSGNNIADLQQAYGDNPTLYGWPVVFVQNMPSTLAASTPYILLGDLSAGTVFGDRRGVTIEVSDQYYFNVDSLAFKATSRYGFKAFDIGTASATPSSREIGCLIVGFSAAT